MTPHYKPSQIIIDYDIYNISVSSRDCSSLIAGGVTVSCRRASAGSNKEDPHRHD